MKKMRVLITILTAFALLLQACAKAEPNVTEATDNAAMSETVSDTTRELTEDEKLLISLKNDIKAYMTENTKDYKVLFCNDVNISPLDDEEKAIWVEELFYAYPDSDDEAEAVIKGVHIYYPMHNNPAEHTESELKTMGAKRIFAYMGVPNDAENHNKVQGIVCTHGGGGHAFAKYCLQAVRHGYAAIAFDTEGYYAQSGIVANLPDPLGHKEKDNFSTSRNNINEQWMYYVISDCAFANTVLRSLDSVDENKVGITGISWGGLAVTVACCYDSRFAFCVPVYLSYFVSSQYNSANFASIEYNPNFDEFASELWQDTKTLEENLVPTLIINSPNDKFADISSSMLAYNTLKKSNEKAYLLIKPDLSHSQEAGASQPEIYRFGDWVCRGYVDEKKFFSVDKEITKELGKTYEINVSVPKDITNISATLYYTTEPISYNSSYGLNQKFKDEIITENRIITDKTDMATYNYTVDIPNNAYLYFISFYGESEYDENIPITYTYEGSFVFNGMLFGSTSIVVVNGDQINK